ncbi:hypothetical protein [Hyalangium versicolor]|uniref:hypothetical protein n=1 Tax=Hyalangium versicolor TaxID=2861190 RepID=UPI001CC9C3FA|nr:hypothetical protein [Hyalangium versicolor]
MSGRMAVEYDPHNDVVHLRFTRYLLVSAYDVQVWKADIEEKLSPFGRKVDLLIDLDGLEVTFTAGRLFGQARREVLERYTQRACSYGGDEMTRMFLSTSGVLHGHPVNQHETRMQALMALLSDRDAKRRSFVSRPSSSHQLAAVR